MRNITIIGQPKIESHSNLQLRDFMRTRKNSHHHVRIKDAIPEKEVKDKDYSYSIDPRALTPNENTPWMKKFMEDDD